jgi:hypothetical protein
VHVEFSAQDPKTASEFYAQLFGWKVEAMPEMDYFTFDEEPGVGGGFPRVDGETFKAGEVVVYVATDDIQASLVKAEALGGKTLLPKTEIPGVGEFAFFSDPTGNRVGLYTGRNA